MGMHSKTKGKGGEREVRNMFRALLEPHGMDVENIRRNHQQAEIGGADLVGVPYFAVEVKRVKKLPGPKGMNDWWIQACDQARSLKREPCLMFRQDLGQWQVMLWMQPYSSAAAAISWYVGVMTWKEFSEYLVERLRFGDV